MTKGARPCCVNGCEEPAVCECRWWRKNDPNWDAKPFTLVNGTVALCTPHAELLTSPLLSPIPMWDARGDAQPGDKFEIIIKYPVVKLGPSQEVKGRIYGHG